METHKLTLGQRDMQDQKEILLNI